MSSTQMVCKFWDNPELATCEAEQLSERIGIDSATHDVSISGNDDAGTCTP